MGKNVKIKILIFHMVDDFPYDEVGQGYCSCNYSCTLHFLVKILLVNLKKLHTSACLNLNYGSVKRKPKM